MTSYLFLLYRNCVKNFLKVCGKGELAVDFYKFKVMENSRKNVGVGFLQCCKNFLFFFYTCYNRFKYKQLICHFMSHIINELGQWHHL